MLRRCRTIHCSRPVAFHEPVGHSSKKSSVSRVYQSLDILDEVVVKTDPVNFSIRTRNKTIKRHMHEPDNISRVDSLLISDSLLIFNLGQSQHVLKRVGPALVGPRGKKDPGGHVAVCCIGVFSCRWPSGCSFKSSSRRS